MTDNVPEQEQKIAAPAAAASTADQAASPAPAVAPAGAEGGDSPAQAPAGKGRRSRGGRGGRGGKPDGGSQRSRDAIAPEVKGAAAAPAGAQRTPPRTHPVLEQLAGLYPQLFGAVFRPLKRGIFQDLQAAHPELFEREALKAALGIHTRSTRYLQSVAAGDKRHDLAGKPVEAMAPEHVHHALLEVYRRRKNSKARAGEDLLPKLRNRLVQAFEASGLTREAYTELVTGRDDEANALLEEAFAEWAARNARDEALLRAFEASGQTLEAFADMYGMAARAAGQTLERARRYRSVVAAAATAAATTAPAA